MRASRVNFPIRYRLRNWRAQICPDAVPPAAFGAAYVYIPPNAGESTRVANPVSPMARSTVGVLGLLLASINTRWLSEGLRAVVTTLYPSAGISVMRRRMESSRGG